MRLSQGKVEAKPFERHLINRRRKRSAGKKSTEFVLMLTSMVDMFSILVIFLLQTFSNSPEIITLKDVNLPDSLTPSAVKSAPVLAISKSGDIFLDQKLIGSAKEITSAPRKLLDQLQSIRKNWKSYHKEDFSGEINFQADKDTSSALVSQVMGLLTSTEFQSIQLAVLGK